MIDLLNRPIKARPRRTVPSEENTATPDKRQLDEKRPPPLSAGRMDATASKLAPP